MKQIRNDSMNTQTAGVWVKVNDLITELPSKLENIIVVEFGGNYQLELSMVDGKYVVTNGVNGYGNNCRDEFVDADIKILIELPSDSIPTLTIQQALELWEDARDYCDGWLYDKRTYFLNKFGFDIDKTVK